MKDATLTYFRNLSEAMQGGQPQDWQWLGKWESQRMFGLTEQKATEYAAKHGGEASQMKGEAK